MDESLPEHLAERFRWVVAPDQTAHGPGEFVLYWMHNALRAHENPALDAAICIARQNGLPLLVYLGLSEDYAYASDRYHCFILQGIRDVQRELNEREIANVFHIQYPGNRGPHLRDLTRRAAVLITEEMPVQPLAGWIQRLTVKTTTPIATVDSSCIVATALLDRPFDRAYKFRDATKSLYADRVGQPYAQQNIDCEMFDGKLPFQPLCLQDICLNQLIGQCEIDHSIAPIADTPGGTRAGYRRWERFKQHGLADYASQRDDATIHNGVSRMSAYLHFGMVSPLRIAREAAEENADKYLDELLVWREMSFHFCHHNIDCIDSIDSLPQWAKQTLSEHSKDPRQSNFSWETLGRGDTQNQLWDACQKSLLQHGELHNNVRMTWGKAFLPWTGSPCRAVQLTMDINHRYALDGRDPSSYGGVLWCYGLFDKPFEPEQDITGTVRRRPLDEHAKRIDLDHYTKIVQRPIAKQVPRVAVIGAGMAGLIAARTLSDHGVQVQVFEKSRGVGGRMSTRRVSDRLSFDHGAQYFTARDARFTRYVHSWIQDGIVTPWMGKIVELGDGGNIMDEKKGTPRFVATPGMNAIGKHLAKDLDVKLGTRISHLQRKGQKWRLFASNDAIDSDFDVVIANCPPPQTHQIINGHTPITEQVASVTMRPCWAVMVSVDALSELGFDGAFINNGPLSWIARNSSKPGRNGKPSDSKGSSWVLHASPQWTENNLELDPSEASRRLFDALQNAIGGSIGKPTHCVAHLWRYAIPANPLQTECLWDADAKIAACGDWCGGPRVEGAFLSGMAMAGTLLRHITIDRAAHPAR